MSRDRNAVEKITKLTPGQVAEFLRVNPEFFEENPDLLTDLSIPHLSGKGTMSLIERQVQVLRQQNEMFDGQLRTFTQLAAENDELWQKFKDLAIFLLRRAGDEELQPKLVNWLKSRFALPGVAFNTGPKKQTRKMLSDESLADKLLNDMSIQCGADFPSPLLEELFSTDAGEIGSSALIPLKQGTSDYKGLLALGAEDPERFSAGQSTAYLECMRQLISQAMFPA